MSTADALEAALVELFNRAANATLELDPKAASLLAASEGHRARLQRHRHRGGNERNVHAASPRQTDKRQTSNIHHTRSS